MTHRTTTASFDNVSSNAAHAGAFTSARELLGTQANALMMQSMKPIEREGQIVKGDVSGEARVGKPDAGNTDNTTKTGVGGEAKVAKPEAGDANNTTKTGVGGGAKVGKPDGSGDKFDLKQDVVRKGFQPVAPAWETIPRHGESSKDREKTNNNNEEKTSDKNKDYGTEKIEKKHDDTKDNQGKDIDNKKELPDKKEQYKKDLEKKEQHQEDLDKKEQHQKQIEKKEHDRKERDNDKKDIDAERNGDRQQRQTVEETQRGHGGGSGSDNEVERQPRFKSLPQLTLVENGRPVS